MGKFEVGFVESLWDSEDALKESFSVAPVAEERQVNLPEESDKYKR